MVLSSSQVWAFGPGDFLPGPLAYPDTLELLVHCAPLILYASRWEMLYFFVLYTLFSSTSRNRKGKWIKQKSLSQ